MDEKLLIALFLFPTSCLTPLSILLQTIAFYLKSLSRNLYNFYTLFLNNLANLSAIIFSVIAIKYNIFENLSHTTKIEL